MEAGGNGNHCPLVFFLLRFCPLLASKKAINLHCHNFEKLVKGIELSNDLFFSAGRRDAPCAFQMKD